MKLLICTQSVDENDPILGFFVRWVAELAKRSERIEVICLREGKYALPDNVHVHALGTEGKFVRAWRFKLLILKLRRSYDGVFVHMNPEYMILGGLAWRVWNKPAALWYNHPQNDLRLQVAALLATRIFYTSPYAATAHFAKATQMPVGIDTELFKPAPGVRDRSAVYLQGRVMPSKRIELALAALRILRKTTDATLTIVGPEDARYGKELRVRFKDLIDSGAASFLGPIKNEDTPALYCKHGVALNLAANGHFDKTAFESMACETPVVVTSSAFKGVVPDEWIVEGESPVALASAIGRLISRSDDTYHALGSEERAGVVREHSLATLIERLAGTLQSL